MKFFLLSLATVLLGTLAAADEKQAQPKITRPVVALTGTKSKVEKHSFRRIETEKEWERVWTEHQIQFVDNKVGDKGQRLSVDFSQHMVVAIFGGKGGYDNGYAIHSIVDGDDLRIRYQLLLYQSADLDGRDHNTTSYCFVVVPRTVKKIVLEKDVRTQIAAEPIWKEAGRLEAPEAK